MKRIVLSMAVLTGWIGVSGCAKPTPHHFTVDPHTTVPLLTAKYTAVPVKIDGNLDDPIWKTAPVYEMTLARRVYPAGNALQESGQVQLAWNDRYFYVGVKLIDSDVVAEGKQDQLLHYKLGDLVELFLKPQNHTWYWELYATPAGKKSTYWFPGSGRFGLSSSYDYTCGLKVAARIDGTLNNWRDKDKGWTAEMAMPIKDLTAEGDKFEPGADWRILVGRYNYSAGLTTTGPELSMVPQLSESFFHQLEEFAKLRLEK